MLNPSWDASQWHSIMNFLKTSLLPTEDIVVRDEDIVVRDSLYDRDLTIYITFFA